MSIAGFFCYLCMVSKCIQTYRWYVCKHCELSDVFIQASVVTQSQLATHTSTEHSHHAEFSNCSKLLIGFLTAAVMTSVCVFYKHVI